LYLIHPGTNSAAETWMVKETTALTNGLEKELSPWCLTGQSGITGPACSGGHPGNSQLLRALVPTATVRKPNKEMDTYASAPRDTRAIPTTTVAVGAQVSY
jgi:hypothetical protein